MEDPKDTDLPTGSIKLPSDDVTEVPPVVIAPVQTGIKPPTDTSTLGLLQHRILAVKDDGIEWFKTHKLIGGIIILITFGLLLYFWPLITCALVAQHMLKNTKGTVNKSQMYKIVAILVVVSLSIQAIWIVQLAQAATFR